MKNNDKTKKQLLKELEKLKAKVTKLEKSKSEHKKTEKEVISAKVRLEHLLAKSSVIIYSSFAKEPFGATYISENVRDIIGYEPNDFLEDPGFWANRIHPDDFARVFRELLKIFEVGFHNHEYRWKKNDGSYIWLHDELILVYDKKGIPIEMVGTWLDITDRKKAEKELEKHRDHLEELVKERTKELEEKNKELKRFNKLFVGREFRIKELKEKVKELEKKLRRKK